MSSCVKVKEVPPIHYYRIAIETRGLKAVDIPAYGSIKVTVKGMMSRSIYYLDKKYGKNAFYLNRWAEPPDDMIKKKIILAIKETGLATDVLSADSLASTQYLLEIEIDDLSMHIQDDGGEGVVVISAVLVDTKHSRPIKNSLFRCGSPSSAVSPMDSVDAINKAADRCVTRIYDWLAK
ncbi:ABC-type transport auxiliary lipoprotein family protein [Dissulfurimicrobium sp.]|uniref:ABC-type transport auxiliary lipoprotein family protein n=1 Tax=Dissulfurimicrobium sp. TaxID=2022436 RepID=UPI003D12B466